MKILIWSPYISLGGGLRLLLKLVDAISRHPDVEFVRLALPKGYINNHKKHKSLEIFELNQLWIESPRRILGIKGTSRLKSFLRRFLPNISTNLRKKQFQNAVADCDLVYCYWPHRQTFPVTDKPVVCTYQDATLLEFPEILGGNETNLEWQLSKIWMEKSSAVVVSSNSTKEKLIKHFGQSCKQAIVIHHAILPTQISQPDLNQSPLLDKLPRQYVVFPANIMEHKNHYNLLVAWSRFKRRKEFPLILFGAGVENLNCSSPNWPYSQQAARLAGVINRNGLVLGEDFYALGYVDNSEVISLITNATALIMPTLAEGGGSFPVEEALSFGVPVLCSDIPVMREHLSYRTAKICWFDPECPSSIFQALDKFFNDYSDYKQSVLTAVKDPRPTWDDIASKYVSIFRTTLNDEYSN